MQFSLFPTLLLGLSTLATSSPNIARRENEKNVTGPTTLHLGISSRSTIMILNPTGQAATGAAGGRKNATTIHPQIISSTARGISAQGVSTSVPTLPTAVPGKPLTTPVIVLSGVGTPNSATTRMAAGATAAAIAGGNSTEPLAQAASNGTATNFKGDAARVQVSGLGIVIISLFGVLYL